MQRLLLMMMMTKTMSVKWSEEALISVSKYIDDDNHNVSARDRIRDIGQQSVWKHNDDGNDTMMLTMMMITMMLTMMMTMMMTMKMSETEEETLGSTTPTPPDRPFPLSGFHVLHYSFLPYRSSLLWRKRNLKGSNKVSALVLSFMLIVHVFCALESLSKRVLLFWFWFWSGPHQ